MCKICIFSLALDLIQDIQNNFLLLAVVLLIVVAAEPVLMTFAVMLIYILSGPLGFIFTWPRRRRLEKAVHKGHEAVHREND